MQRIKGVLWLQGEDKTIVSHHHLARKCIKKKLNDFIVLYKQLGNDLYCVKILLGITLSHHLCLKPAAPLNIKKFVHILQPVSNVSRNLSFEK